MPQSTQISSPKALSSLEQEIQRLQERLNKQKAQGSILLGRWFQQRGVALNGSLDARMKAALEQTLKRPRDRRLFGLIEEGGRTLRSEKLAEELGQVRADLDGLRKREEELSRALRGARRKDEDARLFLQGDVIRRWREKDAAFALALAEDLAKYLKHPNEFTAVEMPVPANWQPAAPESALTEVSANDRPAEEREKGPASAAGDFKEPAATPEVRAVEQEAKAPQKTAPQAPASSALKAGESPASPPVALPKPGALPAPPSGLGRPAAAASSVRSASPTTAASTPTSSSSNGG